jgi:hypothetical protein
MRGAILPLPNTPSWRGAQLKKQVQLYLYVYEQILFVQRNFLKFTPESSTYFSCRTNFDTGTVHEHSLLQRGISTQQIRWLYEWPIAYGSHRPIRLAEVKATGAREMWVGLPITHKLTSRLRCPKISLYIGLTPCNRILLEKLAVAQLVKKRIPRLMRLMKVHCRVHRNRHWSLSCARWIQSTIHPIYSRFFLMLSHLRLRLPSGVIR